MRVHQVRLSPSRQAFYVVKSRGTNCIRSLNQIDELIASKYRRTINNYSGFFLFLGVFLFLNQLVVEAASGRLNHPMNTSTSRSNRYEDLYIVLVSIPLLDKVLPLKHLAEELILRGYRVGFALPENYRQWVNDLEKLEFISLGNVITKGQAGHKEFDEMSKIGVHESYANSLKYYASFQKGMYVPLLEDFEDDRPDIVVVDRYTFAGIDVCHALSIPYVVNNPHVLLDIDSPPAYTPAPFSNITMHDQTVWQRFMNGFHRLRFRLAQVAVLKDINQIRVQNGLPKIVSKDDIYGKSLVLVNSIFGIDYPRTISPLFKMVGLLQSPSIKREALAVGLQTWLDSDETPVIFVSFPSEIPLSEKSFDTLYQGLEKVDARLLWKATHEEGITFNLRSRDRNSIYILYGNEIPNQLVLKDSHVQLFITAGELGRIQQALYASVPILGVPFTAEQLENINAIVHAGAGIVLIPEIFQSGDITETCEKLLTCSSYRMKAQYLGKIVKATGGTAKAADHILTVAEFGTRYLIPKRNLQPLYKIYLVDVYLIYGAILCGTAVILRTILSVILTLFQTKEKEKTS